MSYEFLHPAKNFCVGKLNNVCVILGWLPIEKFERNIPQYHYCVAGNLYTPNVGIGYLVRNLLFNNRIQHLVVCNFTHEDKLTNSSQTLIDLWQKKIKLSDIDSLQPPIPEETINELIDKVKLHLPFDFEDLENMLFSLSLLNCTVERTKQIFDVVRTTVKQLPAKLDSHNIRVNSIKEGHIKVLDLISRNGLSSNGLRELLNISITVDDKIDRVDTLLQNTTTELKQYCYNFLNGTNSKDNYGYGDRLLKYFGFNQIDVIVNKLETKLNTLAANMCLWDVNDLIKGNSPCLVNIWCRCIDNKLHMFATFRSNDMFRAWVSNVYALKALQIVLADKLKVGVGTVTTISLSAHVYTDCLVDIEAYLKANKLKFKQIQSCVGNFVINLLDNHIQITQLNHKSEIIEEYKGKRANVLVKQILINNPSIEADHAAYLGIELTKAESCLVTKKLYQQDRLLKW